MNILEIYAKYQIPPNLVRHQLEVAAVGRYVSSHWSTMPEGRVSPKIDQGLVTVVLLLHDMGNIIKFKRPFLGELEPNASHWEQVQHEFIQKYGVDVHAATQTIIQELKVNPQIERLLNEMRDVWTSPGKDVSWEARICEYADCCVTPEGIKGFAIRIEDLKTRYHMTDTHQHVILATQNARKIEEKTNISLQNLREIDFSGEIDNLKKTEV